MINYKKFITATPAELAMILRYHGSTAGGCVECGGDCIFNKEVCTKELYSWLMGAEDEVFWRGFERWKKVHNL